MASCGPNDFRTLLRLRLPPDRGPFGSLGAQATLSLSLLGVPRRGSAVVVSIKDSKIGSTFDTS